MVLILLDMRVIRVILVNGLAIIIFIRKIYGEMLMMIIEIIMLGKEYTLFVFQILLVHLIKL